MLIIRNLAFMAAFYSLSAIFVILTLLMLLFHGRTARRVARGWSVSHRILARWLLGIRVVETGHKPEGAVMFALRHESGFEAIDLAAALGEPVLFAKEELFAIPGFGRALRAFGGIPVARDAGAKALRFMMTEARRHASSGRPLAIFPEGTRTPHGTSPPLKSGFAGIYKLVALPVVPVAVNSGPLYQQRWKRPGTITLHFGEAIPPGLPRDEIEARVHAGINALNSGL